MKNTDLRINNLVQQGDNLFKVAELYQDECKLTSQVRNGFTGLYQNLAGIQLIDECWDLLGFKIGFPHGIEATNREISHREFPFLFLRTIHGTYRLDPTDYSQSLIDRCSLQFVLRDFKYVHEIQNLFADLTGQNITFSRLNFYHWPQKWIT